MPPWKRSHGTEVLRYSCVFQSDDPSAKHKKLKTTRVHTNRGHVLVRRIYWPRGVATRSVTTGWEHEGNIKSTKSPREWAAIIAKAGWALEYAHGVMDVRPHKRPILDPEGNKVGEE